MPSSATTQKSRAPGDLGEATVEWGITILHCPDPALADTFHPLHEQLRLGRMAAPDVDLVIDDAQLSRRHATFVRVEGARFSVADTG
ncbi:MAG TPA: FHA domain-containing protein, partial [Polyangiaceae bacterium]